MVQESAENLKGRSCFFYLDEYLLILVYSRQYYIIFAVYDFNLTFKSQTVRFIFNSIFQNQGLLLRASSRRAELLNSHLKLRLKRSMF